MIYWLLKFNYNFTPEVEYDVVVTFDFVIYLSNIYIGSTKGRGEKVCFVWNWVRSFTFFLSLSYSHVLWTHVLWTPLRHPKILSCPHFKSPNDGNHQNPLRFHWLHHHLLIWSGEMRGFWGDRVVSTRHENMNEKVEMWIT